MKFRNSKPFKANYLDKKIGWIAYPVLGVSFIFFANDNDFQTLIHLPSFKWDVLFSIVVTYAVGFYLGWINRILDNTSNTSWEGSFQKRLMLQCVLGIVLPLIFSIGTELIYLNRIGISIKKSSVLNLELPLACIYLVLINLLYYLNYISLLLPTKFKEPDNFELSDQKISVTEGIKETLLPITQVAFLQSSDKSLWLHTFQEKQYHMTGSLNEWEKQLPKRFFYRINRQMIAHKDAILEIEPTETRRVRVYLKNSNDEIYLPKTKVTEFRKWWKN